MTDEQKEKCRKIAEHYGEEHQMLKAVEEMAELSQAIVKGISGEHPLYSDSLIEEYADIVIMMEQINLFMYEHGVLRAVRRNIDYKLNRQLKRMESESDETN
jgi:NTP pyrophosphatase (non-canonical NTP hydrolase)